jgi:hypothetical protein
MTGSQAAQPVAGLYPDEEAAARGALELRSRAIRAEVKPGAPVAEGRFGHHLLLGLVAGTLVALPFAILLPLAGWAYRPSGISPPEAIAWLFLPILFLGGFLGLMFTGARYDTAHRVRSRLLDVDRPLPPDARRLAAKLIDQTGGEVIHKPSRGRKLAQ